MPFKVELGADRIRAFLSSSMATPLHREMRSAIIAVFERSLPWFHLFAIETYASPLRVQDHFLRQVKNSDIVLLVLQDELRPGVFKEYVQAKRYRKPILAFVHTGEKTGELEHFIRSDVHNCATVVEFRTLRELIEVIVGSLLKHVFAVYRESLILKHLQHVDREAMTAVSVVEQHAEPFTGGDFEWFR